VELKETTRDSIPIVVSAPGRPLGDDTGRLDRALAARCRLGFSFRSLKKYLRQALIREDHCVLVAIAILSDRSLTWMPIRRSSRFQCLNHFHDGGSSCHPQISMKYCLMLTLSQWVRASSLHYHGPTLSADSLEISHFDAARILIPRTVVFRHSCFEIDHNKAIECHEQHNHFLARGGEITQ
jgi:hypothetical protein